MTCVTSSIKSIAAHADGAERGLSMRDSRMGLLLAAVLIDASAGYWIGQSSEAARFVQVGDARRGSDRSRRGAMGEPDAAEITLAKLNASAGRRPEVSRV